MRPSASDEPLFPGSSGVAGDRGEACGAFVVEGAELGRPFWPIVERVKLFRLPCFRPGRPWLDVLVAGASIAPATKAVQPRCVSILASGDVDDPQPDDAVARPRSRVHAGTGGSSTCRPRIRNHRSDTPPFAMLPEQGIGTKDREVKDGEAGRHG